MKIYFACSIRGGRNDSAIYAQIVKIINKYGRCLSELFGYEDLPHSAHQKMTEAEIYAKDIGWIKEADGIIAEVSTPSLGVGYEIAKAEEWGKPVLALYRPQKDKRLSAMIAGSTNLKVYEYSDVSKLDGVIEGFINEL